MRRDRSRCWLTGSGSSERSSGGHSISGATVDLRSPITGGGDDRPTGVDAAGSSECMHLLQAFKSFVCKATTVKTTRTRDQRPDDMTWPYIYDVKLNHKSHG